MQRFRVEWYVTEAWRKAVELVIDITLLSTTNTRRFSLAHETKAVKSIWLQLLAYEKSHGKTYVGYIKLCLLLRHTNSTSTTACCLCVLTANTKPKVMSHTAMRPDLSQAIEIFPHFKVELIGNELRRLTVLEIALPVKEVVRDFELAGVLNDSDNTINFLIG